jgi:hypothetical protein
VKCGKETRIKVMENWEKLKQVLRKYRDEILRLRESINKGNEAQRSISELKSLIHGRHFDLVERNFQQLLNGEVILKVRDFYQFWTNLHVDNDVIFFRCTSRIDPKFWLSPDMQLYERRQISNIAHYNKHKDPKVKKDFIEKIQCNLEKIKFDGEHNFERIFIFEEMEKNHDNRLDELASIISRQIRGGVQVKTICIKSNEIPTFTRPQDFGIVITNDGLKLLMYLEVGRINEGKSFSWIPEGGHVLFNTVKNKERIAEFEEHYSKIEGKSQLVKTDDPEKIKQHILLQLKMAIDISEIYGNRCYNCLIDAEKR